MFWIAELLFVAMAASVCAIGVMLFRQCILRLEPASRHAVLLAIALTPLVVSLTLLLSVGLPPLLSLVVPTLDHCKLHEDEHIHVCFSHPSSLQITGWLGLLFATAGGYLVTHGIRSAVRLRNGVRLVSALSEHSKFAEEIGCKLLATAEPLCFTAGLRAPEVYMSAGLLETLSKEERCIVMSHECAHVRRRDPLMAVVLNAAAAFHLPGGRRFLLEEAAIAAEEACDEYASTTVGDRLAVAQTILSVERAMRGATKQRFGYVTVAFGASSVARRVDALLSEARGKPLPVSWQWVTALAIVAILAVSGQVHHATETALSLLLS